MKRVFFSNGNTDLLIYLMPFMKIPGYFIDELPVSFKNF